MTFEVKGLHVYSTGKGAREIVKGVSFSLKPGSITAIMGPNGSGKSSLCNALMGDPAFRTKGSIRLGGAELTKLGPDARAKKGIFLAFQNPEEVEGVKVSNFVRKAVAAKEGGMNDLDAMVKSHERLLSTLQALGMDKGFATRELNTGFSGGEKKRMEMLQMLMLKPKVILLDEIDSGLDVDGLKLVARAIKSLKAADRKRAFLLVTHYPRILKYLKPDRVHVLAGGKIVKSGTAKLAHEIEKKGYAQYAGKRPGKKE
ncbi:MAG: Fe-S cluster assembly ATPase SufC [Candidatus ainarchaeum sp.]|nr:Fe-S cluster assembly ATPase SufC [Candidatus ainarchaeum sp.]